MLRLPNNTKSDHSTSASVPLQQDFSHPLVFNSSALRELKVNTTAGQLLVHLRVSIESVIHTTLLLLIEHNLQDFASILLGAQSLADDLNRIDQVGKDGVVDGSESSGTGALLSEGGARAGGALGTGENAARGKNQDMAVGELLLELTGESVVISIPCLLKLEGARGSITSAARGGNPARKERGQR